MVLVVWGVSVGLSEIQPVVGKLEDQGEEEDVLEVVEEDLDVELGGGSHQNQMSTNWTLPPLPPTIL